MAKLRKEADGDDAHKADVLCEIAQTCDGMEVHRDDWAAAELLCGRDERFTLGSARGPNRDFKRLYFED
jgi:hypothetical protein